MSSVTVRIRLKDLLWAQKEVENYKRPRENWLILAEVQEDLNPKQIKEITA